PPGPRGPHPDRLERPAPLHLVIELHTARAGDHHVDLFRLLVAVREGMALPRLHPLQRDPDLLGLQVAVGEAGLLDVTEALRRSHVLDVREVLDRVIHGPPSLYVARGLGAIVAALALAVAAPTDDQLAGARVITGFDGRHPPPALRRMIEAGAVSGVILFDHDGGGRSAA